MEHGREWGHPVAVALIDVDDFKSVNDRFGHQVGDQVLRTLASLLTAACRGTDVAARYAGDEFLLVLPGADVGAGRVVAERVLG
jgi:diguanylate cyclase (GGDEF)-like protein